MEFYEQLTGVEEAVHNILKEIVYEWANGANAEECMMAVSDVYDTMHERRERIYTEISEGF